MIYVLLDNYDGGLELDQLADFDALPKYLRKIKEQEGHYNRIQSIIFGEEVPLELVKEYYKL